jgi:hypothetical protein
MSIFFKLLGVVLVKKLPSQADSTQSVMLFIAMRVLVDLSMLSAVHDLSIISF